MCDQISDAILDLHLQQDPNARVACETLVKTDWLLLQVKSQGAKNIDYQKKIREVKAIGYDNDAKGFNGQTCGIMVAVEEQSPDINQGVDRGESDEQGVGDQGMMFGYACNEPGEFYANEFALLSSHLEKICRISRKDGTLPWVYPDAKSQVTIEYVDGKPKAVHTVVISAHHSKGKDQGEVYSDQVHK